MTKHQKGDGIKPIRCAEDLLGKRFRIPARNVSRGSAGIYDGMILQQVGEKPTRRIDRARSTTLRRADGCRCVHQQQTPVRCLGNANKNNSWKGMRWMMSVKLPAGCHRYGAAIIFRN